jgi:hypothetical protein
MNKNKKNQVPAVEKLVLTPTKQEVVTPVIEEVKAVAKPKYKHKHKINITNAPVAVEVIAEPVVIKVAVKLNWFKALIVKIKAFFTKKK